MSARLCSLTRFPHSVTCGLPGGRECGPHRGPGETSMAPAKGKLRDRRAAVRLGGEQAARRLSPGDWLIPWSMITLGGSWGSSCSSQNHPPHPCNPCLYQLVKC